MNKLSSCIIVRNEEQQIRACLESLKDISDEIIVVDGYSTDKTVEICKEYTDKIYLRKPHGYVEAEKDFAKSKANYDWILELDADEVLSEDLMAQIPNLLNRENISAFGFAKRCYYSKNNWSKHAFYPNYKICLYRKDSVSYTGIIHSKPDIRGNVVLLDFYINHYDYNCYSYRHFKARYLKYARIQASQLPKTKPSIFYFIKGIVAGTYYATTDFIKGKWFLDGVVGIKAAFYCLFLYFIAVNYYIARREHDSSLQ